MVRAIEDLGFDSIWLGEHLLYRWPDRPPRGPWEAWTLMAGDRRGHDPGRVRAARRLHELPQPGAARQAGRDDRRDQRRTVRPRPRRGLERDRVPRVRLPLRPPGRPLRGGVHDHPDAPARGRDRLRRPVLPGPRLRAAAARAAARRAAAADRVERAADAADRRCRTPTPGTRGTPTSATRPDGRRPAARHRRRGVPRRRARPGRRSSGPSPCSSGCPGGTGRHPGRRRRGRTRRRWRVARRRIAEGLRAYAARGDRPRPAGARPDHARTRSEAVATGRCTELDRG